MRSAIRAAEPAPADAGTAADGPTIVSLIASATEIVCALGLRHRLVGRSHECDYPPDVDSLPVLSAPKVDPTRSSAEIDRAVREVVRDGLSVYRVRVDELERLAPGLIVTQDHCEVCAVSLSDVEDALCRITLTDTRICSLHPSDLSDVFEDYQLVADAAGVPERGAALRAEVRHRFDALEERTRAAERRPRVAMIEWLDPVMVAGGWIPELVRIAGGEPVIVDAPGTFRTVDWDDIVAADPDIVVIMPCGFPLEQTRRELRDETLAASLARVPATRRGATYLADGNAYFNRPGPRLADSAELLAGILHPGLVPELAERFREAVETVSGA